MSCRRSSVDVGHIYPFELMNVDARRPRRVREYATRFMFRKGRGH